MTPEQFRAFIKTHTVGSGGVGNLACGIGVSTTFMRDVMSGRREPSAKILEFFGFEKVVEVVYEKKS